MVNRLTNTRYADDILLYAKSLPELQSMIESLFSELKRIGLDANPSKTKILTTDQHFITNPSFIDIDGDFVDVISFDGSHKYLGRMINLSADNRVKIELDFRKKCAWSAFHKHRRTLLNHDISLGLRLKLFDSVVSPAALFCLHTLPLTKSQLSTLGACQRRMLRSICGWRRVEGEDWADTMRRMNQRVQIGMHLYYVMSWEQRAIKALWSYTRYLTQCQQTSPWCAMIRWRPDLIHDASLQQLPRRSPGKPCKRWDDDIKRFLQAKFNSSDNWLDLACCNYGLLHDCESEFTVWMMTDT